MGDMDLGGGYGAGGAVAGLQALMQQRLLQAQLAERQRAAMAEESYRQQQLQEQANWRQMQQQSLDQYRQGEVQARNDANAEKARANKQAATARMVGLVHDPTEVSDEDAKNLRDMGFGVLMTQEAQRPSPDFVGPMPEGTPMRNILHPIAKEQDAQAALDQKAQMIDLTGKMNEAKAQALLAQAQAAQTRADATAAKAAKPDKLPQREDDTVVSIHQMMPMVDELLNDAQARVKAQGPAPQGMLGQLETRVKRAGQTALYKSGIAQAPDTDKRIQLASLLQILGTVPYLRGIRNMQFVNQIQQHLADPSATDESIVERLQTLKKILPGMEQAIYDVHNAGVIPHEHTGAMAPAATEYDYVNGQLVPRKQ